MTKNKKKSTSEEAPIPRQDYGTTPGAKLEAEMLFNMIGTGAYYAIKRPKNRMTDRALRRMIADANMSGDCIINDGSGYFRPGEEDELVFEEYAAKERHRAREILKKINRMEQAFERRYQTYE